jgi:hypothetical protein
VVHSRKLQASSRKLRVPNIKLESLATSPIL